MATNSPVRMTVHWVWTAMYAFLFLASLVIAVLLIMKGQIFGILFIVFSMFVGFLVKSSRCYVEADDERVFVYSPPFGKFAIRWDEITNVETNGIGYVFRGEGKALGFNTMMGDKCSAQLRALVEEQIASRGIEVKKVRYMPKVRPENTRVVK